MYCNNQQIILNKENSRDMEKHLMSYNTHGNITEEKNTSYIQTILNLIQHKCFYN